MNQLRQQIVENFQEKMQLRRSLIELEDQNVQNSIEVNASKRPAPIMNNTTYMSDPDKQEAVNHGPLV